MVNKPEINNQLLERCRAGDIKAQFSLYKEYSAAMYNIAMRFLNNKMDAEDILQESFLTAFGKLQDLKENAAFGTWMKRIVVNKSISFLRKNKVHFEDLEDQNLAEDLGEANVIESEIGPEKVQEAIKELPNGARTILVMYALEGYKHREIAETLKISESTCKTQYKRALYLLSKKLKNPIHVN